MGTDLGVIIAISIGCFTIVGATVTMLLWLRSESRSDWRNLQDQITEDRREFICIINEIKLENKDFHHKLLEIERNRSKAQS